VEKITVPSVVEFDKHSAELGRRDTYIHELHLARISDQKRIERLHQDLAKFGQWLMQAEDERDRLKLRVAAFEAPETQRLAAMWRVLMGRRRKVADASPAQPFPDCADGGFIHHFHVSPYRIFREPAFLLTGWAFPRDGRAVTALRARVDERSFSGTYGLAEPDVIARWGEQRENPRPGFKIIVELPPGRHRLSLEARLEGSDWLNIVAMPIWMELSS
jgi:hypothetical protein